jgi:nicotinamide mononucleotide transporter
MHDLTPEIVGATFGLLYVVLVILQSVWCWPVGLVGAIFYILVFFDARLYGQMGLQGVYVALMFYGWHQWRHGGEAGGRLEVSRTPWRWRVLLAVAGTAFATLGGLLLMRGTDAALPFWDAGTVSFSLVAQFMTTRKWIESWLVWIVVDVVIAGMAGSQGLYPTAVLYAAYLLLAALGLAEWRKSLREGQAGKPA